MTTTIEIQQNTASASIEVAIATPGPKGDPGAGLYGSFYDVTDQALQSATASQLVAIGSTFESDGASLNASKVVFSTSGVYSITWSIQFKNTENNAPRWADVWHVLNGNNIANSTSRFEVPGAHGGVMGHLIGTVNFVSTFNAGDQLLLRWVAESTTVSIEYLEAASNPSRPGVPSIILTVQQIR